MNDKSIIVEKAMTIINEIILSLNEKSLDRMRLSSKSRLTVIRKIDSLMVLSEEDFRNAVENILREELLSELTRK